MIRWDFSAVTILAWTFIEVSRRYKPMHPLQMDSGERTWFWKCIFVYCVVKTFAGLPDCSFTIVRSVLGLMVDTNGIIQSM
jgi:hypothetical protein